MKKKVAVGMSGGVDSSVAAALLIEQGYEVTGVFIEAYNEPGCRTDDDKKDALKAAIKMGIPFQTLDVRTEYKEKVVDYFHRTYKEGRTPNPDVVCNREVKFGIFYDWALRQAQGKLKFDYIATGHYARITEFESLSSQKSVKLIMRARDDKKDQSYFLWDVNPSHLEKVVFPLGDKLKSEVRQFAKNLGFENAEKPDSMGVCMMGELNVKEFLREKLGENPGAVVMKGVMVGRHSGLWFHTIGQRGGFEIDKNILKKMGLVPEKMGPLYVIAKEAASNILIVGEREEAKKDRFSLVNSEWRVPAKEVRQMAVDQKLTVRIRNLGELEPIKEIIIRGDETKIVTGRPVFGVAEGQAAVLYAKIEGQEQEVVVGGGEISPRLWRGDSIR